MDAHPWPRIAPTIPRATPPGSRSSPAGLRPRLLDRPGRCPRLHPLDDADQTAAAQVRELLSRLDPGGTVALVVFDAGYDSAQLTLDLASQRARCWG